MKTIEAEAIEKQNYIFIFISLGAILITLGATVLQHYSVSPEVRELHSLQRKAISIQKVQKTLEKMLHCEDCNKDLAKNKIKILNDDIAKFNKRVDEIGKFRELYPPHETIPKKFNLHWESEQEAP